MDYKKFISYNIVGGIGWVAILVLAGYFFGQLEFVKQNLTAIIFGIIIASFIPAIIEYTRHKKTIKE